MLDTNVLVAALRSSVGASFRLLQTIEDRVWQPVVSPALALEYEAVLKRNAADTGLTPQDVDDFIEYICSRSRLLQIFFRWRPVLHDPDDDRILELAFRAQCAIVTFNARHFTGAERFGIRLMTPRDVLVLIGERRDEPHDQRI